MRRVLPADTRAIGSQPYAEFSVGIENIFQFIRVDFARRLTYTDGITSRQRNFIRLGASLSL